MLQGPGAGIIRPGLVSISFRALAPERIVALCAQAGLAAIEWGGDVHVPHGDLQAAREVLARTSEAGLVVSGYGSYYRAGASEVAGLPFRLVLDTALALGAPRIRVWAGTCAAQQTGPDERAAVIADLQCITALASAAGVRVVVEHHGGTLCDSPSSSLAVLREVPGLHTGWQPYHGSTVADRLADLRAHLAMLQTVHVFHWRRDDQDRLHRLPLAEGAEVWRPCLDLVRQAGRSMDALLEFVPDDDPGRLASEAETLKAWL